MSTPLRVGVVGVGHLGIRHAQIFASLPRVRLVAVCDRDADRAKSLAGTLGCRAVTDHRALIGEVDAATVAVPTSAHAEVGLDLLEGGVHLLIEKPLSTTLAESDALIRTARRRRRLLQVGHVERFNAAIHAALKHVSAPRFIEVHRLSPYPNRGTDVSVVLDVMIHDLDMLLALVRSRVRRLEAVGVRVLSPSEDIVNARLSFASGCIANVTASRISDATIRRIRVFQDDRYLSIDYQAQTVELARKTGGAIRRVALPVNRRPPLEVELAAFARAVATRRPPIVPGEDGRAALALALRIEDAVRRSSPSSGNSRRVTRNVKRVT